MTAGGPYKGWSGYMFGYCVNTGDEYATPPNPVHAILADYTMKPQIRSRIHHPSDFVSMCDLGMPKLQTSGPPTSTMATRGSFDPTTSSFILGYRPMHNGQGNILFMDGSVRSYAKGKEVLHLYSVPGSINGSAMGQSVPWN
jgi:prepilin-type processing-associated H-X9-DG protein